MVLYSDATHANIHEVLKMLLVFAKNEPLIVAIRYKRPELLVRQHAALANDHVAGFQVDLRLKSTQYKFTDDAGSEAFSEEEAASHKRERDEFENTVEALRSDLQERVRGSSKL